jgi:zinc transport system substrate-binding protein
MDYTRRSVLGGGASLLALGSLAGCLDEPGEGDGEGNGNHSGYASFFALYDWTNEVGGDAFSFENPVDVGEMGHGWEPAGDLAVDIAETDAFVYLDTPEYSWAQDLAATLEDDYPEVALIDGMDGLEEFLIPGGDGDELPEPDDAEVFEGEEVEIVEFDLVDPGSGEVVAYWHDDHWHGEVPDVGLEDSLAVGGVFVDGEDRVLPLGEGEPFQLEGVVREGAQENVEVDSDGEFVEFTGVEEGRTQVVFELVSDGEVLFDTTNDGLPLEVVEEVEEGEAPEFYDPHVWVDPVIAMKIVETIADGLAEIDEENAESYEENAVAYTERLEAVHGEFEALSEDAERQVAVFAGHDSYGYIEDRYGFELHTPVGIAPDDAESLDDVAGMIEVVEEHDIETILYDPFESPDPDEEVPQMVELIIENSDASEAAPLSPAEGTTPEWNEEGWGWVEQMEEVNIPSLRRALGAGES